ncbi:uncharacterized protein V6R79_013925 [Siganus canaliculatus]
MEEKAPIRSAMVSRLPKFGGRSSAGGIGPLSNGSAQPTIPSQDSKSPPSAARPNGVIRSSHFSLKWKRDEGMAPAGSTTPTSPGDGGEDKAQLQLPTVEKEVKKRSPGTPKMQRAGPLMAAVSSPKAIPKQSLKMSPKVGTKLGQSPLNGGPKVDHNGSSIPTRTGSESHLVRPKLGSSSPRSSSQDSLSQSSDSLKNLSLDNMVRSNSFTHFKQIPSPTNQPMTRSFSFNRAVELAKPLANTQLRPPRSSFLKPPQLSNGRLGGLNGSLGGSGNLGGGLQYSRTVPAASSLPTLSVSPLQTTPKTLRKPLLPSCVLTKTLGSSGGSLGYRLARPGQTKQQPLFSGRVKGDIRPSVPPECGKQLGVTVNTQSTCEADKADSHSDSDGSSEDGAGEGGESDVLRQRSGQTAAETLEDMSVSSASSLDRVDTSEELLDDVYSVGDVLSDGDLPDNRDTSDSSQNNLHSFLNQTLDWDNMDLEGHKEESPMQDSQGPLVLSSSDALQASSVELSPSNSSGGTYMWDEDGLEPIGGPGVHLCDSYDDSELNSIDILNNLDHPGTGDLDEDDLMLDVDLPEDGLHDADRMSHSEGSDRPNWQGQRRKHQRWSGPDHFHSDRRARVFQHYDGVKASRMSSRPTPSEGKQQGYRATLDELTLEHMTQDCSSLKNQLLRLKTLLQLEDTGSPTDVPVEIEDNTTASQLEDMIKEVQMLRTELRSRDKTIAQLTLQCQQLQQHQREQMSAQGRQARCQCHHQRAPSSLRQSDRQTDKRLQHHYDKATQTYWRPQSHAPQILQPFSPCPREHTQQEKLVKTPLTEGHSSLTKTGPEDRIQNDSDCHLEDLSADASGPADPNELSHLLSTHLHRPGSVAPQGINARDSPVSERQSAAQRERRAPAVLLQNSATLGPACPRMLQPPRLHKHVSLPALRPGATGAFAPLKPMCSLDPLVYRTKQLPPPSRGLPCFNTGPQVQPRSLCRTSLLQPHRASEPCRNPRGSDSSPVEPSRGTLREPGPAKTLIPLNHSSIPKPKIP